LTRDLSGRAAAPCARDTLYAARAGHQSRNHAHHADARQRARGEGLRRTQWRLDRGAPQAPAAGNSVRRRARASAARRAASHRASRWRPRNGVDRNRSDMPLLIVAGERAHLARRVRDFLKREAKRDLDARAGAMRHSLALRSSVSRSAISRAAGARVRRRACSLTRGVLFSAPACARLPCGA